MEDIQKWLQREKELKAKITAIEEATADGEKRVLQAIKEQRWYFFKNHPKVIMDSSTGILWANLDYYPYSTKYNNYKALENAVQTFCEKNDIGFSGWDLPSVNDFAGIIDESAPSKVLLPFMSAGKSTRNEFNPFKEKFFSRMKLWNCKDRFHIELGFSKAQNGFRASAWHIPCTHCLVEGSDYEKNVAPDNRVYTELERLQFTLDLFVKNKLQPIFTGKHSDVTELYRKMYFEKTAVQEQLESVLAKIAQLKEKERADAVSKAREAEQLSCSFDYQQMLEKYDVSTIDASVIKYYEAVQSWCAALMGKLADYDKCKADTIRECNAISLQLSKKYEQNSSLDEKENKLLQERQQYFQGKFYLGMSSVRKKLLIVKKQADALEARLDAIDEREDSLYQLAMLAEEKRPAFLLLAENTAKIIRNALSKIEYFEANKSFVQSAVAALVQWEEEYKVFKTTSREALKNASENDSVAAEVWQSWYEDWTEIRYKIEEKMQPLLEWGLQGTSAVKSVSEQLLQEMENYKKAVDKFFLEERKGVYQKFAFQTGGELQEKFETESRLYKCTSAFQTALQNIIFACEKAEDRMFILNWANSLLDLQIAEVLAYVESNELKQISQTVLADFAKLKQKNYDAYLYDAKAYAHEQAEREKQYNSLIFKMRSELAAQQRKC